MLFRRKGTASTILTIALLIALIASVNSLVNNVNSQSVALSQFASIGKAYLIVSENSKSLIDSQVSTSLANSVKNNSLVEQVLPQTLLSATAATASSNYAIIIRGVEDPQTYFNLRQALVNGTIATNQTQANIGEILAKITSIKIGDKLNLSTNNGSINVEIVGITTTTTQSDSEITLPLKTTNTLTGKNESVTFIEFTPKDPAKGNELITNLNKALPGNTKITKVQQLDTFAVDVNSQILSFLNLWSIIIYAIVAAASYVVATRLIAEANFELSMLKTLGAKRKVTIQLILTHTTTVAVLGTILGLATGIVGAQLISNALRWIWASAQLTPFLEVEQIMQITLLSLASSILGCIYPTIKSTQKLSLESNL
jgi:ABC-type lipoprotein release transport system permease subunit